MVRCPNCSQKTKGDFCQWCGYPIMRGRPVRGQGAKRKAEEKAKKEAERAKGRARLVRGQRAEREAKEKARKEAELEARERAKREAEEAKEAKRAKEKAKKEAELEAKEKAKKEAELEAKERAKREAEEAKEAKRAEEKARKEAELAAKERAKREAEEKAKKEAKRAEEKAKEAVEPAVGAGLYEGVMELTIVPPIDLGQMENLEKDLRQVENLRLVLVGGSVDEGNKIVVSAEKPIPLLRILGEMPAVEQVVRKGDKIQVTLKAE